MSIYTKTGDKGLTSLFGGKRVIKSDLRVEAYGQIDELSSFIGLIIAKLEGPQEKKFLTAIQKTLYLIMSILSGAKVTLSIEDDIAGLEKRIDQMEKKLPPLHQFILPQGNELASIFHITRAVCRRAERNVVRYLEKLKIENLKLKIIIVYLNRLSDLLFILARFYNIAEITS